MKRQYAIGVMVTFAMAASAAVTRAQDTPAAEPKPTPAATPTPAPAPTTQEAPATKPAPRPEPTPTPVDGLEAVTTSSGLKYYDIAVGEGEQPRAGARVRVHCITWLADGTLVESSYDRGEPLTFRVGMRRQIRAWTEGVLTMKVGGKRRVEAPAELAWGSQGRRPNVPPNADVIFEMELVAIEKQGPAQTPVDGIEPVTTESGLKYWDIVVGTGDSPGDLDRVRMLFGFWLEDGTLLLNRADPDKPHLSSLSRLVEGWAEGLRSMKVGGKRRLLIPPELGYGDTAKRGGPPPDSTLIVEMELLEVLNPLPQTPVDGIEPVVTESGLKYWDIKEGTGEEPSPDSKVRVHYCGWLTTGYMFDSSVQRDEPIVFPLNRVIPGWTEGVGSMKVGGKRRLEIPPDLAYGKRGRPDIPPDSTLIFEIELLGIE